MSFARPQDIYKTIEELLVAIWSKTLNVQLSVPFPHMKFAEAISRFGSDKPDTRFGMEIKDISDIVKSGKVSIFTNAIKSGNTVKAINVKGMAGKLRQLENFLNLKYFRN